MTYRPPDDLPRLKPRPTRPSPMVGQFGGAPDAPPMPWRKYVFYLLGFPVRTPKASDRWKRPSDDG